MYFIQWVDPKRFSAQKEDDDNLLDSSFKDTMSQDFQSIPFIIQVVTHSALSGCVEPWQNTPHCFKKWIKNSSKVQEKNFKLQCPILR